MSIDVSKLSVDSRDYVSIYNDLVAAIPDLSKIWNTTDESDPGIVLVKLMSMYGDMLSYNHDRAVLEVYPSSVTLRKNAEQIFRLIGYKMRWYRSAVCTAFLTNTNVNPATLPEYTRFVTKDGSVYYTYISTDSTKNPIIESNTTNNGTNLKVRLIQGYPRTPTLNGSNVVPMDSNDYWHSVYNFNVSMDDIVLDNRIYLQDTNVDETSITLIDDMNEEWNQVDNIESLTTSGKYYELRIDEEDRPYIELISYWRNFSISKFKLFYVISSGVDGSISENTLYRADSKIVIMTGTSSNYSQINVANNISITNEESTYGYNPETAAEAREESSKYINTYDTLITAEDFTRAVRRIEGVANCSVRDVTDNTNHSELYLGNGDGSKTSFSYSFVPDKNMTLDSFRVTIKDTSNPSTNIVGTVSTSTSVVGRITGQGLTGTVTVGTNSVSVSLEFSSAIPSTAYIMADYYYTTGSNDIDIYVTKTSEYEGVDDDVLGTSIITGLRKNKLVPLTLSVNFRDIVYYDWNISGTIYLKEKVTLDKAQNILVNINNNLRYYYSPENIDYNSMIAYIDLIKVLKDSDDLIYNIDLDPISYVRNTYDSDGNITNTITGISREEITGKYRDSIPVTMYNNVVTGTVSHTPIKPGTFVVRVDGIPVSITDNRNGGLVSDSDIFLSGSVDYNTGLFRILFNETDTEISNLTVSYDRNVINMVRFGGLNINSLVISDECIKDLYY